MVPDANPDVESEDVAEPCSGFADIGIRELRDYRAARYGSVRQHARLQFAWEFSNIAAALDIERVQLARVLRSTPLHVGARAAGKNYIAYVE